MQSPASPGKFDLLIFDLDGTLVDSQGDVGHALNRTLAGYGLPPIAAEEIRTHVGYGIQPLLAEKLAENGIPEPGPAFAKFAEFYFERCAVETRLYAGVAEGLARLSSFEKVILTNKSTKFISPILRSLGIESEFSAAYGRDSFARPKPDPLPIQSILKQFEVHPERALMIGDTETDVVAGTGAGVATCLVTYGYGNPERLAALRPTHTVDSFAELLGLVTG